MRTRLAFASVLVASLSACALVVACSSSSDSGGSSPSNEAGASSSGTSGSSGTSSSGGDGFQQKGKIIVALQNVPLPGAKVTIADQSAVTKDDGTYELGVPKTPFVMKVEEESSYTLYEQEFSVKASPYDRGETSLLAKSVAGALLSFLQGRDETKALLIVKVVPTAPCDDEGGSTIAVDPPGATKVTYIKGGTPSPSATSVTKGESFSAVVYNLEPNSKFSVNVTSPKCKQQAYPVDTGEVVYTGQNQKVEAGEVISFQRVFIKDPAPAPADAGTD